jgi:hypothetical protein
MDDIVQSLICPAIEEGQQEDSGRDTNQSTENDDEAPSWVSPDISPCNGCNHVVGISGTQSFDEIKFSNPAQGKQTDQKGDKSYP